MQETMHLGRLRRLESIPHRLLGLVGIWHLPRRLRATIYGIFYITFVMAVLPWLAARWLGADVDSAVRMVAGGALAIAGLALFLWCVVLVVRDGKGTQSPLDPPCRFVATGPYRYVRNPMLLGNLFVLLGEAAMFASPGILIFAVLFFILCQGILLTIEEPALRRRFGATYKQYCRRVPRWLPGVGRRQRG
jgi:protein-S-isoprenylcysteine O-methyltransferase Ste14